MIIAEIYVVFLAIVSNCLGGCYASVCVYFCVDDVFYYSVDFLNQQVFFYFKSFYAAVLNNTRTVNLMQTLSLYKKANSPILLPVQKV
jgi:hypothetical protein